MAGFTPTFNAFKNLANLARSNPEQLVAQYKKLTPEQQLAKLQEQFKMFQRLPETPDAINKMTAFLTKLNETAGIAKLTTELQQINAIQSTHEKFEALKKLFQDTEILKAFAACWNTYLQSQSSVMDKIAERFEEVIEGSRESMKHVDSQGDYDPTKKLVRDLMRLFYALFDALLVSAGYQDVFVPGHDNAQDEGYRDLKRGITLGQNGARPLQE